MYAIIPSGGIPQPHHSLYPYTQGGSRVMIDVNGRPMLQHVLDALDAAASITGLIVIGLPPEAQSQVNAHKPIHFLPDGGSLIANVKAGLAHVRATRPDDTAALICSADVPHIQGHMVDELVHLCQPFDHAFYYTIAAAELIEARYPHSQRTYTHFADGVKISGGDVFVVQVAMLDTSEILWESITNARKRPWRMAQLVGLGTLFKLLTRRLSIEEAAARASRIIGKPVKVLFLPYAELAMDADKPHQIELLRRTSH